MIQHIEISAISLRSKIKNREISFAGNKKLKIYGLLSCKSGKRMKQQNRVFFSLEQEARENQFRPCGHCMKTEYKKWKDGLI
ncbi:Ada metal-binding domain-containing protein [Flavobacterium sp. ST-75]|uniref:Ada metal-binding domain-containing protein n=1 Tax=Flavobacterium rhizophilum TaxID=3163296 RepID=A0ABW8YJ31_9FLAO